MTSTSPPLTADTEDGDRTLRVLVADDVDMVRDLMVRMVEMLGHDADVARDGIEAVDALSTQHYDLLLLDLSMPRMSGMEVARWVLQHPEHCENLTIAVVSASAREERPALNELGITMVMPKPFRKADLETVIAAVPATQAPAGHQP